VTLITVFVFPGSVSGDSMKKEKFAASYSDGAQQKLESGNYCEENNKLLFWKNHHVIKKSPNMS